MDVRLSGNWISVMLEQEEKALPGILATPSPTSTIWIYLEYVCQSVLSELEAATGPAPVICNFPPRYNVHEMFSKSSPTPQYPLLITSPGPSDP